MDVPYNLRHEEIQRIFDAIYTVTKSGRNFREVEWRKIVFKVGPI